MEYFFIYTHDVHKFDLSRVAHIAKFHIERLGETRNRTTPNNGLSAPIKNIAFHTPVISRSKYTCESYASYKQDEIITVPNENGGKSALNMTLYISYSMEFNRKIDFV